MKQLFDLTDKVALVTGGASGLGKASAAALNAHGATTIICDIQKDQIKRSVADITDATGSQLGSYVCDVRQKEQVKECVDHIVCQYGRIDILVNNAGIHRRVDPLLMLEEDVEAVFDVNLKGCLFMASTVGKEMLQQQSGSIINISALGGGLVGLGRGGSVYGVTKGGIIALTRDLAAEWGRHGIRVNAIAPGWIRTPMTEALQSNADGSAQVMRRVPAQRWGEPEDVAGSVCFLASDAASYINGHTIPVDGGAANVIAFS